MDYKIPRIETERLLLRAIKIEDAYDMYEYCSNPDVTKFLTFKTHITIDDTKEALEKFFLTRPSMHIPEAYCLEYKENQKMIGTCDYVKFDEVNKNCEIGYCLNNEYWHKGLMSEALNKIIEITFTHFDIHRIQIRHIKENIASKNVILNANLQYEGCERDAIIGKDGKYHDICYYAILKGDWENEQRTKSKI